MSSRRSHLAFIGVVTVASLVVIPYAIDTIASGSPVAKNRQRIAAMSAEETARLNINYKTFKRLKEKDREELRRLRSIHDQLKTQPELVKTAGEYRAWLNSLDSWQQEPILAITDPDQKFAYVSKMLDRSVIRIPLDSPFWKWTTKSVRAAFPDGIEIPRAEAEAMANHLRSQMAELYSPEVRAGKNEDVTREQKAAAMKKVPGMILSTAALMSEPKVQGIIEKEPEQAFRVVVSLLHEYEKGKARSDDDEAMVQAYFASLSKKQQEPFMQMAPDMAWAELQNRAQSNRVGDTIYDRLVSGRSYSWRRSSSGREGSGFGGRGGGRGGERGGPGGPGGGPGVRGENERPPGGGQGGRGENERGPGGGQGGRGENERGAGGGQGGQGGRRENERGLGGGQVGQGDRSRGDGK